MNLRLRAIQDAMYQAALDRKNITATVSVPDMTLRGQVEKYEVDPGNELDYLKVTIKVPIRRDG